MTSEQMTVPPEDALPPLVLTLDLGSSSTRAFLFDCRGRQIEGISSSRRYQFQHPEPGAAELNPQSLLLGAFECIDQILSIAGDMSDQIRAVAPSMLVANVMGISENGQPLTPLYTYADTRGQNAVQKLKNAFDEKNTIQRTGCRFHTSYLPARLLWLEDRDGDLYRSVHRWISFGEYLQQHLFGEMQVSYSVASWSGLLNRHSFDWDEELLAYLKINMRELSKICDISEAQFGLTREYALRWPQLSEIAWFPAIGDGAAENIGSMCLSPQRVALSMGTSSAMRITVPHDSPSVPNGLWCYQVTRYRSLIGGALSEGGNLFQWLSKLFQSKDVEMLNSEIARIPPDSHQLTFLPFLAGERSPGWASSARAAITGISLKTTRMDIFRAGMESVAIRLAFLYEQFGDYADGVERIVAGGGAIQNSPIWAQMIADALNRPILLTTIQNTSSRGAALLALETMDVLDDIREAGIAGTWVHPDRNHYMIYRKAMERQRELYDRIVQ